MSENRAVFDRQLVLNAHTLSHFAVDFTCYYFLMNTAWPLPYVQIAIIYCLLAFALQFPIGLFSDHRPDLPLLPAGLSLVLLAFFPQGLVRLLLMATGNALFHTYAGRTLLKHYTYTENGWFNGAGGFGLVLGTFLGLQRISPALPLLVIGAFAALQWVVNAGLRHGFFRLPESVPPAAPERFTLRASGTRGWIAAVFILFMAATASEMSVQLAAPDPSAKTLGYLFVGLAVWLFKTLGSRLFERAYSPGGLLVLLLCVSALGLVGSGTPTRNWILFSLLLSINLYPLYGLKKLLPERVGFAFGLNKLGLALAFLLLFLPRTALLFKLVLGLLLLIALAGALSLKPKGGRS